MSARVIFGSLCLIAAVLGVGSLLAYVKYRSIKASSSAPPPPEMAEPVTVVGVETVEARQATTAIGTVVAPRWIMLCNEVAGRIESIALKSGQVVDKGQILIELEKSVELAELKIAQSRQRIAESTFKRTRLAASSNAVTELEVEQAEASLSQAAGDILRLEAIIDKKTIRAPFAARAGLVNAHEGQYVSEGTEFTMLQGVDDYIHVDFMVPQHVAEMLRVGDKVSLQTVTGPTEATVVARDAKSDRSTRSLMVRADLLNPPATLVPNDAVTVTISYGPANKVGAVPAAALRRSPEGAFVFAVSPDHQGKLRARRVAVLPGPSRGSLVTILGGLAAHKRVVSDGSFKLRDGALISDDAKEIPPARIASEP